MFRSFILLLTVFLIALSGHARAANYNNPIDGVFRGIYSNTISIEVPAMVAKSPVSNEDQNGDLFFQLKPDTAYRNFNQLTDLKYDDPVRIEYTVNPTSKDKQMVASVITKLEPQVVTPPVNVVTTTTTRVNSQ